MGEVRHARVEEVRQRHHHRQSLQAPIEFVHNVDILDLLSIDQPEANNDISD